MKIIGIIPARMDSRRFAGKPLAKIMGIPMLGHVWFRSRMNKRLSQVYIATCDREITDYARSIGAEAVMTSNTHKRASERTAEAAVEIDSRTKDKPDIVVMIQGDEPMLVPEMIDLALKPMLEDDAIQVTNLMARLQNKREHRDPNEIKVVVDKNNFALYFSREPISSLGRADSAAVFKQVCIIPFRRDFLAAFVKLAPTPLEIAESIDMLRVMEHGYKVKMVESGYSSYSVDTPADLRRVEKLFIKDPLLRAYK